MISEWRSHNAVIADHCMFNEARHDTKLTCIIVSIQYIYLPATIEHSYVSLSLQQIYIYNDIYHQNTKQHQTMLLFWGKKRLINLKILKRVICYAFSSMRNSSIVKTPIDKALKKPSTCFHLCSVYVIRLAIQNTIYIMCH